MRSAFLVLAITDFILMSATAVLGLAVSGESGFGRHFLMGLLTGLFTCFVHVVTFMYFVVCEKVMRQAVLAGQIPAEHAATSVRLKTLGLRSSIGAIMAMLLAIGLGGAIGTWNGPAVHGAVAFGAIFINGIAFGYQFTLIDRSRRHFDVAFDKAADGAAIV